MFSATLTAITGCINTDKNNGNLYKKEIQFFIKRLLEEVNHINNESYSN